MKNNRDRSRSWEEKPIMGEAERLLKYIRALELKIKRCELKSALASDTLS